ncbi:flagellar biosynthesis anti-sigma factor FlgM [Alicyclobacillus fodiniaquatilis]|uniref:Flagellar biosynthesis anti-sigma factor FlgM n=1 Tax=Alicyclobacillus fodiniaquatilis TaxID=1661150 RepID=A0ABW4JQT2_9BACL
MLPPEISKASTVNNIDNTSGNVSDKVKQLRDSIANGTYQVNTQKIAQNIVKSGVLNT